MREKTIYKEALLREIQQHGTEDLGRCQIVVYAGEALGLSPLNSVTGGFSADLNPIFEVLDELIDTGYVEYQISKPDNLDLWTLTPKGRRWLKIADRRSQRYALNQSSNDHFHSAAATL